MSTRFCLASRSVKLATTGALLFGLLTTTTLLPAQSYALDSDTGNVLKQSAIGAGAGAILGGVSRDGSALKGAGIGALSGAGSGMLDNSDSLRSRPIVKDALKGAAIGAGASGATGNSLLKGGALGGAVGAGWGWLRKNR